MSNILQNLRLRVFMFNVYCYKKLQNVHCMVIDMYYKNLLQLHKQGFPLCEQKLHCTGRLYKLTSKNAFNESHSKS